MIIYLAGQAQEARKMKHREKYRHVLFSKAVYSKRNFRALKRRKLRELEEEEK